MYPKVIKTPLNIQLVFKTPLPFNGNPGTNKFSPSYPSGEIFCSVDDFKASPVLQRSSEQDR